MKPKIVHPVHGPEPTGQANQNARTRWCRAWTYVELNGLLALLKNHQCRIPTWVMTRVNDRLYGAIPGSA